MNEGKLSNSDRELIARTLRAGGTLSLALLVAGSLLRVGGHPLSMPAIGTALLHAGLIALLATPVSRIVATIWVFGRAGDRRFLRYSLFTFVVVLGSVAAGLIVGR